MKIRLARLKDRRTSDILYFPLVESLAIGYLAANLRKNGFNAEIIDEEIQDFSRLDVIQRLSDSDLLAFTATARPQIYEVINAIKRIRKKSKNIHITIGGQFATYMYEELLNLKNIFNSVVLYEGEETIVELARCLQNKGNLRNVKGIAFKNGTIIKNELRPLIADLEELPFPSRDLLPEIIKKGGLAVISSSRGCYNRCSYCTISQFYNDPKGNPFRVRSAENVIKELKELKRNHYDLKEIWFVDDNFVIPGEKGLERTKKLCKGIKSRGLKFDIYLRANDVNKELLELLKESGIRSIFIGAESGCEDTLKNIFNKNTTVKKTKEAILLCKEFGINADPGFIMFHPWSTMKEIEENIKFLKEIGVYTPYGILSFLTTYKFTPIGRDMLSGKRKYKKQRTEQHDFLEDDVPYEIVDEKVELLLSLTIKAFENFRQYPRALFELKRFARLTKKASLEKYYFLKFDCFNKMAMQYFRRLFFYLKNNEIKEGELMNFLNNVCKNIQQETQKHVDDIYSRIKA